jgi:dTDP-4-amino-4,6-dideoxygalactose transaminase
MNKVLSVSLSPNTEKDDSFLAFKLLFNPLKMVEGKSIKKLEKIFRNYFGFKNAFSFNSGRSSLIAILKSMEIGGGDEVILQAFTCNAAVNPIIYLEAKPVFVDIDNNLNMSVLDLKRKITEKTKAIMIQHTFGSPAEVKEIQKICTEKKIYLIEDCAHALGATYEDNFCGSFGDASFFSFGRDKIISSVYGGMVTVNNESLISNVSNFYKETKYPSFIWTLQQLLHPVLLNYIILPLYRFKIGRILMALFINFNILSKAVTSKENKGKLPEYFPKRMPNALAILAINQFKKLERFNNHRRMISKNYDSLFFNKKGFKPLLKKEKNKEKVYLKYPILVSSPSNIVKKLKAKNIYISDGWTGSPVVPPLTSLEGLGYVYGACPEAERISKRIICLPTHINISKKDAKTIFDSL